MSESSARNELRQLRSVAAAASIVAVMIVAFCAISRRWLPTSLYGTDAPLGPLLGPLGAVLFLMHFPLAVIVARRGPDTASISFSRAGLHLLLALAALVAASYLPAGARTVATMLFAAFGLLFGAINLLAWLRGFRGLAQAIVHVALIAAVGVWCAATVWSYGIHSPVFLERLAYFNEIKTYNVPIDLLFHASILNSLLHYGVASVGLDGIPPIPYHVASHWLFGRLAELLSLDAISFYNYAYPVIFIPLLLYTLLLLASEIWWYLPGHRIAPLADSVLGWILLGAFLLSVTVWPTRDNFANYSFYLNSESFNLSLSLSFIVLSIALSMGNEVGGPAAWARQRWVVLGLLPILLVTIGLLKMSTLFIIVPVLGYLALRRGLLRDWKYVAAIAFAAVAAIAFLAWFTVGQASDSDVRFHPFHYLKTWRANLPAFFFHHYFWLIAYCLVSLVLLRPSRDERFAPGDRSPGRHIDVEVLLVAALMGLVPGSLFALPPHKDPYVYVTTNYYFSSYQGWIAAALLLGRADEIQLRLMQLWQQRTRMGIWSKLPLRAVIAATGCYLAFVLATNLRDAVYAFRAQHALFWGAHWKLGETYMRNPEAEVIRSLLLARRAVSDAEKRSTLVYIPQGDSGFWNAGTNTCRGRPFLVPAITGMAMLDGMPQPDCPAEMFGYQQYTLRASPGRDLNSAEQCQAALAKGFTAVLTFVTSASEGPPPPGTRTPVVTDCRNGKGQV